MEYNNKDIDMVIKYKESNMSNKTIAALLNKQSINIYTEDDIQNMYEKGSHSCEESGIENSRLFEIASSIVFNPRKRKAIKIGFIIALLFFISGLLLLGVFVSWNPVIIIVASILGIVVLTVLTIFVLFKTGAIERYIEKHNL